MKKIKMNYQEIIERVVYIFECFIGFLLLAPFYGDEMFQKHSLYWEVKLNQTV